MSAEVEETRTGPEAGLGDGVSQMVPPPERNGGFALRLDNVTKEYPGDVQALRGVTVEIKSRDQVAVIGPSGSGKTTLLTIMGTLERPTAGEVHVAGYEVGRASDVELAGLRAHRIGFVFQDFHLQEHMSALDNVANGMLYMGVGVTQRREAARFALERVGLANRIEFKPKQLSGASVSASRLRAPSPSAR